MQKSVKNVTEEQQEEQQEEEWLGFRCGYETTSYIFLLKRRKKLFIGSYNFYPC